MTMKGIFYRIILLSILVRMILVGYKINDNNRWYKENEKNPLNRAYVRTIRWPAWAQTR